MRKELTLKETLQIEIEFEEKKREYAFVEHKSIDEIVIIQKRIEYLKVTLEDIQERYNTDEPQYNQ
jgi:hypothetical protein